MKGKMRKRRKREVNSEKNENQGSKERGKEGRIR